MNHVWQLQEAKEHLGSVIEEATKNGAQIINSQGIAQTVVLSMENYQQLLQPKS
jgi:prevent-host-death family protein